MRQGQSDVTHQKEYDLGAILRYLFRVHEAIVGRCTWLKWPFVYCDINCGSGHNHEVGCEGSPMVFMRAIADFAFPTRAYFIDIEKSRTDELLTIVPPAPWVSIINGDHGEALPRVLATARKYQHGLIYHDPNGLPAFGLLASTFADARVSSIDVLIRLNATVIKRCRTAFPGKDFKSLKDELGRIGKRHWLIQEPQGRHQFSFFLGTNWDKLSPYKKYGLHLINSPEGASIFDRLNYTKNEIEDDHPNLPYDTYDDYLRHPEYLKVRAEAIIRAAGRCELCGDSINGNVNVHHVAYPPWGTFEKDASNLLAICYLCHCKVHGKES